MRRTQLLFALLQSAPGVLLAHNPRQLTIKVDGIERHALVFAPGSNTANKIPLLLVFHGHGGSANGFAQHGALHKAWPEALVVYPQGIPISTGVDPKGLKPGWQRKRGEVGNRD